MILVVLLLIFCLLLLTPVRIEIIYRRQEQEDHAEVVVSFWFRWLRLRWMLPQMDWQGLTKGLEVETNQKQSIEITKERLEQIKERTDRLVDLIPEFLRNIRRFLRHVHFTHFHWSTVIGTGEAMETGLMSGLLWAIKTNLYTFLNQVIPFDQPPEMEVVPRFAQSVFSTSFQSIICFRMGYAILAMTHVLRQYWKRRRITWQKNTPFKA